MTLATHNRTILFGFMLAYAGVMGSLTALSFEHGTTVILAFMVPLAVLGVLLISIAKLSRVQE